MPRKIWLSTIALILFPSLARWSVSQQTPSIPISESTLKAGDRFVVEIEFPAPLGEDLRLNVTYGDGKTAPIDDTNSFGCYGDVPPNQLKVSVRCETTRRLKAAEYRSVKIVLVRGATGEQQVIEGRLPILTIAANPYNAIPAITIANARLSLTASQSLSDGAVRLQEIVKALNDQLSRNRQNSAANRTYLREQAEVARTVIDLTRRRYMANETPNVQAPIFFQDFDLRLDQIVRELGGTPRTLAKLKVGTPQLILVQLPQAKDSVTVTGKEAPLDKALAHFVDVLTDAVQGFLKMAETGKTNFVWSITTIPEGAEVYVTRLSLKEEKLTGVTNLKDQTLPNARWTFRIDWKGCSKTEEPNPFLQKVIDIHAVQTGCKKQ